MNFDDKVEISLPGMEKIIRKIISIDAENKSLGRLAVEVAVALRGKNKPSFVPYMDMGDTVMVKNIEKMKFTGNKLENKNYFRFTGYLGNLKKTTLKEFLIKKGPKEVLRTAVMGMLTKNKLRALQIKRLKFEKKN
ncbi:MAG: 50S ribosomal protein L13 [Synergistaceae bacterium]|nr:50S ribosomal protein L13 [Synergistaceae bacterium]